MDLARPPLPPATVPDGHVARLAGRGEVFYRHSTAGAPGAPTLLLLHGWTASADIQWFSAYAALAERYPFIAIDHRGHGRGMRSEQPFTIEDVADDAAALARHLGVERVVPVGYSMGGPVTLELTRRHPDLVAGMVLAATSMEFMARLGDRVRWRGLPLLEAIFRSRLAHRAAVRWAARQAHHAPTLVEALPWLMAEMRRGDPGAYVEAGRALSRFDARPYAPGLAVPSAMVITTRDRLVPPVKQRQLARAVDAEVVELAGDHLCTWFQPDEFAAVLRRAVDSVADRIVLRPVPHDETASERGSAVG
jgi:pimeloyl-ACP methyl ester carboxylesterase